MRRDPIDAQRVKESVIWLKIVFPVRRHAIGIGDATHCSAMHTAHRLWL